MQNDYIMRIIEQFIQAIIAIVQRRKSGNYKEALELIQKASRYYLKTGIDMLLAYSPEQIVDHFKDSETYFDAERCILCADLLYELALINEALQQKEAATGLKATCLHLYQIAIPKEQRFQVPEYLEKISVLTNELENPL